MKVTAVPLNSDNYGFVVVDEASKELLIIDVSGQPDEIMRAIAAEEESMGTKLNFTRILSTHHHWDHSGGNDKMKEYVPGVKIYGGRIDNCEGTTHSVEDGEDINDFGTNIRIKCIWTPGHTKGHICYYFEQGDQRMVFTGDILFIAGVGKFFEGTAAEVYPGLEKLKALPDDTLVYCAHEYTLSNYKFALSIDPDNTALIELNKQAQVKRDNGEFTIPSTIAQEKATNPFLRVTEPFIEAHFPEAKGDAIALLQAVREAKNNF